MKSYLVLKVYNYFYTIFTDKNCNSTSLCPPDYTCVTTLEGYSCICKNEFYYNGTSCVG